MKIGKIGFLRLTLQIFALIVAASACLEAQNAPQPLAIVTRELPAGSVGRPFTADIQVRGGKAPYTFAISQGRLPGGLRFDAHTGRIIGSPATPGRYRFTIVVTDSTGARVELEFTLVIGGPLTIEWKVYPQVQKDNISGQVVVSNYGSDSFDLTVIIMAVNDIGRATVLGYQHFPMKPGVIELPIPFGEGIVLGNGHYVVHADAVGESEELYQIFHSRLQTPQPLTVDPGF